EDGGLETLERMRARPGAWPSTDPAPVLAALDAATGTARWCADDTDKLKEHLRSLAAFRAQLAACDDDQSVLQFLDGVRTLQCSYGQLGNWDGHVDEARAACAAAEQARQDLLGANRHAVLAELGARLATFVMTVADQRG